MSLLLKVLIGWLAIVAPVLALLRMAAVAERDVEHQASQLTPAPAANAAPESPARPRRSAPTRGAMLSWVAAAVILGAAAMTAHQLGGAIAVGALATAAGLCGWGLAATAAVWRRGVVIDRQTRELAVQRDLVLSLVLRLLKQQDPVAAQHAAAVAHHARTLAGAAGLSEHEQRLVHSAGLLHDLGLHLPVDGRPTDALDGDVIRAHPLIGARWVRTVPGLEEVAAILEAHHERVDGTGYPHGLRGEEIPRTARIIAIAEVYDVLTAPDTYRSGHSHDWAAEELRRVTNSQLDARLVELFLGSEPRAAARPTLDRELIAARHMATQLHARAATV